MFESAGFGFTGSSGSGGGGVTGANNGLTLVGTTVNLGNSESGSAAVLTSDREIPMDGFELRFIGSEVDPGLGAKVFIGNGRIDIINNPDNIGNAILGFKDNSTGLSTTIEYDTNLLIAQDGQCNVIIGGATGNASLLQIRGSQFDFSHQPSITITETGSDQTGFITLGSAAMVMEYGVAALLLQFTGNAEIHGNVLKVENGIRTQDIATWIFGAAAPGAPTPDTSLAVNIEGADYLIAAEAV
jgi:hypothetical protein